MTLSTTTYESLGALTSIEAQRVKDEWRALFP